jgi:cell division protein FtsI (penicillin-binding protein 3)
MLNCNMPSSLILKYMRMKKNDRPFTLNLRIVHTTAIAILLFFVFVGGFSSCKKQESTLDASRQATADSVLRSELMKSGSDSALVIVMSVKTGEVKTMLKLVKQFSTGTIEKVSDKAVETKVEPGPIFIPISMLAAMDEAGLSSQDMEDAGNGLYVVHQRSIYDKDAFEKGGYGVITLEKCITYPSFIGTVKTVENAFKGDLSLFEKKMRKMSFGQPADSNVFAGSKMFESKLNAISLGLYCYVSPMQLLTAYNAIANNGKMMKPAYFTGESGVINEHICSEKSISEMQRVLTGNGKAMLSAGEKESDVAVMKVVNGVKNAFKRSDTGSCCGYFPAGNPEYTCLVVFYRSGAADGDAKVASDAVDAAIWTVFRKMAEK